MNKVAIVYWSGTGNTEAMANIVATSAKEVGAEVSLYTADSFDVDLVENYDALAFGCPSMGGEVLEEDEFQPMWDKIESTLKNKKVALFGSYGWGDGEWMRSWEDSCQDNNITLVCDSVICVEEPDTQATEACKSLGKALCLRKSIKSYNN